MRQRCQQREGDEHWEMMTTKQTRRKWKWRKAMRWKALSVEYCCQLVVTIALITMMRLPAMAMMLAQLPWIDQSCEAKAASCWTGTDDEDEKNWKQQQRAIQRVY